MNRRTTYVLLSAIVLMCTTSCAERLLLLKGKAPGCYTINGKTYQPWALARPGFTEDGLASWYGPGFDGKTTASGEPYDMHDLTAAHKTLPMDTLVAVVNLKNKKNVLVRINDRGPFVDDRIIDLSLAAAEKLDIVQAGTAPVRVCILATPRPDNGDRGADERRTIFERFTGNPYAKSSGDEKSRRRVWARPADPETQPATSRPPRRGSHPTV